MTATPATCPVIAELDDAIDVACTRIAPTWPLDRFIAVNPYWGWREKTIEHTAARLAVLSGARLTMARAWYREEQAAGRLDLDLLDVIAAEAGDISLAERARRLLTAPAEATVARLPLITDLADGAGVPAPGTTWTDHVVHQIGQHTAAHFDDWQSTWPGSSSLGLYQAWHDDPTTPHSLRLRRGRAWGARQLAILPRDPRAAIGFVLDELAVPPCGREAYLTALLTSVNGWAAWCAYRRWQARLAGADDDTIVELLAVRIAWEWLLAVDLEARHGWDDAWANVDAVTAAAADEQAVDWLLQAAVERTYQRRLAAVLTAPPNGGTSRASTEVDDPPAVQAVFCIDVRSEIFRRALESTAPLVQTRGFAGFFGLPIAYSPAGSDATWPQLPGLLSPALYASEAAPGSHEQHQARTDLERTEQPRHRWEAFRHTPSSMFAFVESTGALSAVDLLRGRAGRRRAAQGRPRLTLIDVDPAAAAAVGHKILTNMGLTGGFAPLVLLCGHGSSTTNNPHAAGLHCGACGGRTGEVNARVLADLLNTEEIRRQIAHLGIEIPESTWFVPGLHDTTTDEVTLFDADVIPARHRDDVDRLREWLRQAAATARAERAPRLGLGKLAADADALERVVRRRARDWSEVRPEWGLAGNAAFVVAPRRRTRHANLEGRAFLHDYDWRSDHGLSVLTLILTAPMVVTNWINLQYLASTVDPRRYGSGNKVLHNVVGGSIGVFEGNGGDLRIGLPLQSLHDAAALQHAPLRLSVLVEAPRAHIDTVIAGHEVVDHLVHHGWLHLLRIDPDSGLVERRTGEGWHPL